MTYLEFAVTWGAGFFMGAFFVVCCAGKINLPW